MEETTGGRSVPLRLDGAAVGLTLGEAMRAHDHMSAAIDLVRDDRSVMPDLIALIASLSTRKRAQQSEIFGFPSENRIQLSHPRKPPERPFCVCGVIAVR